MNCRNNVQIDDILASLSGMKTADLEKLAGCVFDILKENEKDNSVNTLCEAANHSVCKKCGSIHIVKRGRNAKGHQRYWCKDCGSVFTASSDTVFSCTHKDADTWKNFILFTMEGHSLRYCAQHCNISLPTSFAWRHKIMNALTEKQFADKFAGLVEVDELFVKVSYKGNHKNSKTFTMPRKPYKRGTDNRSLNPSDKACVLTVLERSVGYSGLVTHRGQMKPEILSSCFDKRITNETIVMSDKESVLKKYFSNRSYEYIPLASSQTGSYVKSAPVTKGPYHINNINGHHSRFRLFLRKYNGVATKHLNAYLALFIWLENARISGIDRTVGAIDYLSSHGHRSTYKDICSKTLPAA